MRNIDNFDWGWMEDSSSTNLKPLLIKEIFDDRIYERFFEVEEGDIVFDAGSSVGPFAYSIVNKNPKHIYCIEPSPVEFPTLNRNLRGYPVTTIKKGVGSNEDGFFSDMVYGETSEGRVFIESISFGSFLKEYGIDKIDFLKTDCEGGEYDIFIEDHLNFLKTVPKITGEWHLQSLEEKEKFRKFRDNILIHFPKYEIFSVDGIDIKWDLWNEHFIEYYRQIIVYIDNR